MWKLLLAAVAGCTAFAAKHFLNPTKTHPLLPTFQEEEETPQCKNDNAVSRSPSSKSIEQDESPSWPKNTRKETMMGCQGSKKGIRILKVKVRPAVEIRSMHRKGGKRLAFCLKSKKTTKNIAGKPGFCSSQDSSLFGWGVSFGIMCMMAGKAEISELSKTMNETAKVVEELKFELSRRKSSCARQTMDSGCNIGVESCEMSSRNDKIMLKETHNELTDSDVKICGVPVSDDGECGSSALTEEPDLQVLEMDQLEAELELELQKLHGCTIDTPCHEEIRPKLDEETHLQLKVPNEGCHVKDNWNSNSSHSHGILASELNQKLSRLLIQQQERQIVELESELHLAQSKLEQKEAELQALKDCVRCLTELPLSTYSEDETEALKGTSDWDSDNMDYESKQSVIGVTRPIDSESCAHEVQTTLYADI